VFGLSDANQLVAFAQSKHLGRLAFWSATRDHQCSGATKTYTDNYCSSVLQANWAFSRAFSAYNGGPGAARDTIARTLSVKGRPASHRRQRHRQARRRSLR
jgi:hypothetical protein